MINVTDKHVKAIKRFNSKLKTIEAEIKQRGLEESQIAINRMSIQEHDISGYELDVEISMHSKNKEPVATWFKDLKPLYLLDDKKKYNCNIDDGVNYNSTTNIYENDKLHKQKHCWLLHSLYHDIGLPFENILNIEYIWFDIKIKYQYVRRVDDF